MDMVSIAELPRYEAYKESGYEWIGNAPSSWEVSKLGSCLSPVSIKNHPELPLLSITREQGVIERDIEDQDSNHNFIPDDLSGYKLLKKGQFGMNKMKAWQGSYGVSKHTGIVSPAYFVFDFVKPIFPPFFNWAIRSNLYVSYFGSASDGVRVGQWDLSKSRMKVIPFLVPSEQEQKLIASFLDKKTTQIDEAIAIKEQQIALLKERKQIIIQKVVTQGLDPNSPLIETELSWAPKIASHWSLLPNRLFMKIRRVPVGHAHKNYQLLSLTKQGVLIRDLSSGAGKQSDFLERMQEVREGDLIFCLFDVEETPRTVGLSGYLGMISADYTIFECIDELTGRFLEYFYKHMDDQKLLKPLYKGLRNRIPKPRFLRTYCPMPPRDELIEILQYLDDLEVSTTHAIEVILSQMEKLKEYKATLINSAVTGKIKVTPEMAGLNKDVQDAVEA